MSTEQVEPVNPPVDQVKQPEQPEHSKPNEVQNTKNDDFVLEKIEHKPNQEHSEQISGVLPNGVPFELEKVGEIMKEEECLKNTKRMIREMISQIKGVELTEKNVNEVIDQVDKSCMDEIISTKMRVEWERSFVNHYDELCEKLKKFSDLTIDLENSRIVVLENKSSDYEIVLQDQEIDECLKRYGDRVVGRGLHARVILEMLILNDIIRSISDGLSIEEAVSKYDPKEIREVGIRLGEHETDLKYREGIAYAFLIILESHNIGIKELEDGEFSEDQKVVQRKYK